MLSVVYGLYPGNLTVLASSAYASLGHTAWAMAVAFIVIQCCTGSARMIDSLLSLRLMYPLSRLTYCAYLVHPVIMMITCTQMDGPLHLHNGIVVRSEKRIARLRVATVLTLLSRSSSSTSAISWPPTCCPSASPSPSKHRWWTCWRSSSRRTIGWDRPRRPVEKCDYPAAVSSKQSITRIIGSIVITRARRAEIWISPRFIPWVMLRPLIRSMTQRQ